MARVVGIDIRPTEVLALAIDADDGEMVARAHSAFGGPPLGAPRAEGAVVAEPDEVFAATRDALHSLVTQLERAHDVRAIGLCGGPGIVLLDETRHVATREHASAAVPIKDYVGMRLTGVLATDLTESRERLPASLAELEWPPAGPCGSLRGALSEDVAEAVHLADGMPVVRGCTRIVAGMLGMGAVRPTVAAAWLEDDAVVAIGAPGSVERLFDDTVLVHAHALSDQRCVLARTPGAGAMLDWYCDVLCDGERMAAELRRSSVREIVLEAASTSRPGGGGVLFTGNSLVGMSATTSKADLSRALLEGAAFSLRSSLRRATGALGGEVSAAVEEVRLAGPWAKSAFFRQLVADILDVEVAAASQDAAALGTAALAAVGVRALPSLQHAVEAWAQPKGRARPETATAARYRDVAAVYDGLLAALREPHARLAKLP